MDFNTALLPYGDKWRLHRRFFHHTFRMDAVQRFLPFHHRKACQYLRQLFSTPEQFDELLFEYVPEVECIDQHVLTMCEDTRHPSFSTARTIMTHLRMTNSSNSRRGCKKSRYLSCVPTPQSSLPHSRYVSKLRACLIIQEIQFPPSAEAPGMVSGHVVQIGNGGCKQAFKTICRDGIQLFFTKSGKVYIRHLMHPLNIPQSGSVVLHHPWYMMHCKTWMKRDQCRTNHG